MSDGKPEKLKEFRVTIEFHAAQRPDITTVIARGPEDAKEIARRLFVESRTGFCVIDSISAEGPA